MNDPIFILGAHKSGTSLLRSLFDGHEKLFAIPVETHLAKYLGWWTKYPLKAQESAHKITVKKIIDHTTGWINECNNTDDRYSDNFSKNIFNLISFKSEMAKLSDPIDEREYIEMYFSAIYTSITGLQLSTDVRVVEKSVENIEHALRLKNLLPGSKFIHIIRNPYSNLVTLRKYMQKLAPSYPHLDKLIKSIRDSFYYAQNNRELIKDYMIIRYEDLVVDTETIMKMLCEFVGIQFIESLVTPSFQGKLWGGNSVTDRSFTQVSTERLNPWKREINALEIKTTNTFLGDVILEFAYEKIPNKSGVLWPMKHEKIKEYIGNRLNLRRPY